MSAKSQFLATNSGMTEGDNLLGSIALAMADVTKGHDAKTTALINDVRNYADANSNGQRVGMYIAKLSPEVKTVSAPSVRASAKMGTGMM